MTLINKIPITLTADPRRVITQPSIYPGLDRIKRVYERVSGYPAGQVNDLLAEIHRNFAHRHRHIDKLFMDNYVFFSSAYASFPVLPPEKQLLLGATLTKEYSIQSAALFNPSMVLHPDQSGLEEGQARYIISLRSVGEGHISSIEFRSGVVDEKGHLAVDPCTDHALMGELEQLDMPGGESDYNLVFPGDTMLSERVIFPQSETEIEGMEDLRLVLFREGGATTYYGTYTAYDGRNIRPQLLETEDFKNFRIRALKGEAAEDKGMALFPEKINGRYGMISRQGGENISIMFSDDLYVWEESQLLMKPKYAFEVAQLGNCGSPVKTREGWLLMTHGVGAVRQYTISAALLDLDHPQKVIARLDRPFIQAEEDEREGYVPNVVYSCGSMLHEDLLYIPYAMSDTKSGFAWVEMKLLLDELLKHKC